MRRLRLLFFSQKKGAWATGENIKKKEARLTGLDFVHRDCRSYELMDTCLYKTKRIQHLGQYNEVKNKGFIFLINNN